MIIAFSGKAQNGKTEGARIVRYIHPEFVILSFATPLKRIAMEQFGLSHSDIADKTREIDFGSRKTTVRQLLIDIGKMYRAIDPDFWVKKLWKDIELTTGMGSHVVIDDMRFLNEANFLKAKGAKFIRVSRPGVAEIDDISETELDDYQFEHRLLNDGSMEDYEGNVIAALDAMKEAPLP
jgi:hypothetical protein